ncbi:MAG: protein kinase [Deltaproteobacteria bacterium]|nr:protein kinase [Deltaproteobacteria bacterium]
MKTCLRCSLPNRNSLDRCAGCGALLEDPDATKLIEGRYRLEGELGRGAMGIVHRATDVTLGRKVAIKMLYADLDQSEALMRFMQEARSIASVRNDHVVGVYSFGECESGLFIAMEYIDGTDLDAVIDQHALHDMPFSVHRAGSIIAAVAKGLGAVHSAGAIHLDVKPANIVIEHGSARPVLVDFGLARFFVENKASSRDGTPAYMSPEAFAPERFGSVSHLSDQYALACTAFQLLSGEYPFQCETFWEMGEAHILREPRPLSVLRPHLASFDRVFARALQKKPSLRYESVLAFASDFSAISQSITSNRLAAIKLDETSAPSVSMDHHGRHEPPSRHTAQTARERRDLVETGARVLVVDDDPAFARLCARALQLAFYRTPVTVEVARSGTEALKRCKDGCPDILLLDYLMPELDGVETLSLLRDRVGGADMDTMVMSAGLVDSARNHFSALGVQSFLAKPIEFPALVEALRSTAERRGWIKSPSPNSSGLDSDR